MRSFRYEYRFDLPDDHPNYGVRVQFMKDFATVDEVADLANHPHGTRRSWAKSLLTSYRSDKKATLSEVDYFGPFGDVVRSQFPTGATVNILEPNDITHDIILVIQVIYFHSFSLTDDVKIRLIGTVLQ